jgi:hypothetical protein
VTSWDDATSSHKPVRQSVRIPMRADLLDRITSLEQQAARERAVDKRENRDALAPAIAEQIRELEDQVAASEVEFTFEGIGRRAYAKLVADNPPTAEQKAEAEADERSVSYNPDTFPPRLLAASCVAPEGASIEGMTDVWENWSEGQAAQLWTTCLTANLGGVGVGPKSQIASAILDGSAKS